MKRLTGQKLADVYGYRYAVELQKVAEVETVPTIYSRYLGGGWIEIHGSGLPPHKDLRELYPNGWCLGAKVRSKYAREYVADTVDPFNAPVLTRA